jgi:hypothetical protein
MNPEAVEGALPVLHDEFVLTSGPGWDLNAHGIIADAGECTWQAS